MELQMCMHKYYTICQQHSDRTDYNVLIIINTNAAWTVLS